MASADRWNAAFKKMFPDSKIAKKFQCSRSKTTVILKEICNMTQKDLVRHIKNSPFTISTDGSIDLGSTKQFPLLVRTVIDGEANSFVLTVPIIERPATGRTKNILLFYKNVACVLVMSGYHIYYNL